MALSHEALSVDVGKRLHELREAREISMRALAARSGLSANALSMIERGRTSPSVSTLYKLAEALGVPVTEFFAPGVDKQRAVLVRTDERTRVPFAHGVWEGLGGEKFTGRVEPFVMTLETGASSGTHPMVHTGHEFVYVLRGRLEYLVEDERYELEAGDSLLFAAQLQHRWRNPGHTVANVLIVLSGFAEGEHPDALHWQRKG
jgi:transcriptional regulator with XRE-family HTH domain